MLMCDQCLYETPNIGVQLCLWSLQIITTLTEGALLIFLQSSWVQKLLYWLGIKDLSSQSRTYDHSAMRTLGSQVRSFFCLGRVSHLWVWKISLKVLNFSIYLPSSQKNLDRVGSKNTWVKGRLGSYLQNIFTCVLGFSPTLFVSLYFTLQL